MKIMYHLTRVAPDLYKEKRRGLREKKSVSDLWPERNDTNQETEKTQQAFTEFYHSITLSSHRILGALAPVCSAPLAHFW